MSYQSKHTGDAIDASVDTTQQILNLIYPIGAVYISVNDVSPANFIGGTWERIQDRFLVAAGSSYGAGTTGGATSHTHTSAAHTHTTAGHTLTINEMPKHGHGVYVWDNAGTTGNAWFYNGANKTTHNGARLYNSSASTWIASGSTASAAGSGRGDPSGGTNQIGGGASHNHGDTGSTTPGDTGSSSNLPPYLSVYMWKRTS